MIKQFCDHCEKEITSKQTFYNINTIKQVPVCDCRKPPTSYQMPLCDSAESYKNYVLHEACFNLITQDLIKAI